MATGVLNVGDVLVWKRSGKGEEYHVAVVAGGDLQLPDGSTTASSSSAASAAAGGTSTHALDSWKRDSDGKSLRGMWQVFEERFGGDCGGLQYMWAMDLRSPVETIHELTCYIEAMQYSEIFVFCYRTSVKERQ